MSKETFFETHSLQLSQVPKELWDSLYNKLSKEILDAGTHFSLRQTPNGSTVSKFRNFELISTLSVKKNEDIFLVDHLWTFDPHEAYQILSNNVGLVSRLEALIPSEYGMSDKTVEIIDTTSDELPKETESDFVKFDANGNMIEDENNDDDGGNDSHDEQLIEQLIDHCNIPRKEALELLKLHGWELIDAITHAERRNQGIPDDEYEGESSVMRDLREQITRNVHQQQEEKPVSGVRRKRQASISDLSQSERINRILDAIVELKLMGTYDIVVPQQHQEGIQGPDAIGRQEKYFFISDEVGSSIISDITNETEPNVKMITFIYNKAPQSLYSPANLVPFNIFWPIKDIESGDIINS